MRDEEGKQRKTVLWFCSKHIQSTLDSNSS